MVSAAFFIAVAACGTFFSFGVFLKPILAEFGWTRALTSGAYSLAFILSGLISIATGRLNDRFGPRMVMTACGIFLGCGYILMSQIGAVWQLYIFYGVIVGAGYSGANILLLSTVARWFTRRKGLMSGIVVCGIGVGMMVMPPISRWLISVYGWRNAYIIVGIIVLVCVVAAAQFLRRDPARMGLLPYGEKEAKQNNTGTGATGLTLGGAIRTRQFWMFFAVLLSIGIWLQTTIVHIAPHATDMGMSPAVAATILTVIGALSIPGKLLFGTIGDRIGNKLGYILFLAVVTASLFWLIGARELWTLYLFAAVFGFGQGGGSALWSPLVAELFGLTSHGVILGAIYFGHTIGATIGPVLAGYIFDVTGSYYIAFLICAVLCAAGLVLTLFLKPIDREKERSPILD